MITSSLAEIEEYAEASPVRKCLNEGARSRVMLIHLLPGQEVPPHPHPGHEIILLPQKGHATLTLDGNTEIDLEPGRFYAEEEGHTVGIKNTGSEPFQMVATLIRLKQ